jgi:hypothetical protein
MEVGAGMRYLNRTVLFFVCALGVLVVLVGYDLRAFRNLSASEAMDSAQLARNLAQGKGYTTLFVRPLSVYLLAAHSRQTNANAGDPAQLRTSHPDLANPPVYPVVLAGLMKALPFKFAVPTRPTPFWSPDGRFYRYQPDFLIALFNQALLCGLVVCVFFLARRLFDTRVATLSAVVLFTTEVLWRFSVSGLSTLLLLLIFMALIWCVVLLEEEAREPKWNRFVLFVLAALTGGLVGLGGLTRYSFCWLAVPVVLFVIAYTGKHRAVLAATVLLAFAVVLTPWVIRNYSLSGTPFGTATFALIENSGISLEDHLERSLNPAILKIPDRFPLLTAASRIFWQKLVANGRGLLQSDLPKLGGTWVSAFFLVGLLVSFRSPRLGRLRWFVVASLVVLAAVQALGRTKLSDNSPEINSENLLVLLTPMVMMYGVSLFFVLLDQAALPFFQLRPVVVGLFGVIAGLPLILALLPPRTNPIVYPPYYPPSIQTAVGWTKEDELLMSDIPWAVAWYGQSQCMWLTLSARADFYAVNDYLKPISALYLTAQIVDRWTQSGDWANLFVQTLRVLPGDESKYPMRVNLTLPQLDGPGIVFPLHYLQAGWPMQLLFTYREHWPGPP